MAEIKSTMELVMERAARFGKASADDLAREEARKTGMQLGAALLAGKESAPLQLLQQHPATLQSTIRSGMIDALLRALTLSRDKEQGKRAELAVGGIIELGGGAGDLRDICRELQHIIGQHGQHREQLRGQLEEQVRMQYEQLVARQTGMAAGELRIDPTMQPKFKEEWTRIEAELNSQYGQALEQYKAMLRQRLGV